jgi:short-subunit dehydrogenase
MSKGQVIVTGASRGIGEAIAIELDRRGFDVAALSRSGQGANL